MVPRIPSWTKGVAVAVLPVPPRPFVDKRCCSRRSPRPSASLRGQKVVQLQFSALRSPCPSVALRGQKVLQFCSSPCPSVALRGQKVLQFCSSPCPSVALRGQKVLQFCSSPCPSVALRGQKVLQLQFSVSLRGPSWTKGVAVLQFSVSLRGPSWTKGVAVAVLRVPPWLFVDKKCCSCSSPCPSVALRGQKVLQFCSSPCPSVAFVDKRCCSCSSPWSSVALRGQKVLQLQFSVSLRGPSWTKGVAVLQFSVALPPWLFVDKRCCSCSSPCPSVDQKTVLPAPSCILVDE